MHRLILFYWQETGVILDQEMIREYFSQEFEADGSRRLYNNGNHPEIQSFVEWMWDGCAERWREFTVNHREEMLTILWDYAELNEDAFKKSNLDELSPEMLWAIARAMNNPNYVLDLTSLQ